MYPFLHNEIVHVGGRRAKAKMPDEAMYPQIVLQKNDLARLVIHDAHLKTLHGGTIQTIAEISTQFWIPACRNQVRKVILNCITCCIFNSSSEKQLMGHLPKSKTRVPSKAFQHVGLDFRGPFFEEVIVKTSQKHIWLYSCASPARLCIWIPSLISQPRHVFTSRRGCPATMTSDNSSNFQGPLAELLKLKKSFKETTENSIQSVAAVLLIEWNFIPHERPTLEACGKLGLGVQKSIQDE